VSETSLKKKFTECSVRVESMKTTRSRVEEGKKAVLFINTFSSEMNQSKKSVSFSEGIQLNTFKKVGVLLFFSTY
jgi:hypothetical protein